MSEHELWNELGNLYFLARAYPQAVEAYYRSIHLDEGFGRPYSNLALTYVQQGKYDKAIELYRRSIDRLAEDKEKAISWNRLGNAYRLLKDYQHAVVAYRMADRLDPDNPEGRDEPGWFSDPDLATMPAEAKPIPETAETAPTDEAGKALAADDLTAIQDISRGNEFETARAQADVGTPQQALSLAPDPESLKTWGAPEFDEGHLSSHNLPADPETEVDVPDPDGDDLSRWLSLDEDQQQGLIHVGSGRTHSTAEVAVKREYVNEDKEPAGGVERDEKTPAEIQEAEGLQTAAVEIQASADWDRVDVSSAPASRDALLLPLSSHLGRVREHREAATRQTAIAVGTEPRPASEFVVTGRDKSFSAVQVLQPQVDAEQLHDSVGDPQAETETAVQDTDSEREAQEMREIEAGIDKFKRVVQINPRNAHAWDALGSLYKSACRYKEALVAYQQAIANDPSRATYHHHLGLVYACEGRTEDAISAYQRVIEIDPDHSLAHAALGGYYRKLGFEELAQKHVGKAMKSIFDSENEYNRACLAAICGNTDQALELLRVALNSRQTYVDWILRDPDLDFIRQDPRFKQLISDYTR